MSGSKLHRSPPPSLPSVLVHFPSSAFCSSPDLIIHCFMSHFLFMFLSSLSSSSFLLPPPSSLLLLSPFLSQSSPAFPLSSSLPYPPPPLPSLPFLPLLSYSPLSLYPIAHHCYSMVISPVSHSYPLSLSLQAQERHDELFEQYSASQRKLEEVC